jgi:hypothetical protein
MVGPRGRTEPRCDVAEAANDLSKIDLGRDDV